MSSGEGGRTTRTQDRPKGGRGVPPGGEKEVQTKGNAGNDIERMGETTEMFWRVIKGNLDKNGTLGGEGE